MCGWLGSIGEYIGFKNPLPHPLFDLLKGKVKIMPSRVKITVQIQKCCTLQKKLLQIIELDGYKNVDLYNPDAENKEKFKLIERVTDSTKEVFRNISYSHHFECAYTARFGARPEEVIKFVEAK